MRIKKILKALMIVIVVVGIIIAILTNSKHLWKLFGYSFCEEVESIQIYSVTKDNINSTINIKGAAKTADGYFAGYTYNIKNNELHVGLKYNKYFGYDMVTKEFNIQVPCRISQIDKVFLTDKLNKIEIARFGGEL